MNPEAVPTLENDVRYQEILAEQREKHGDVVTEIELQGLARTEFLYQYPDEAEAFGIRQSRR